MDVAAVGSTGQSTAGTRIATSLKPEDFFKLLIAELQNQDPFEPMDNAKMVQQIASIREIELSSSLADALKSVTTQQRFAAAASLIGKYVVGEVTDASGQKVQIEGVVTSVRFEESGNIVLELDNGEQLPLDSVRQVSVLAGSQQANPVA